MKLPPFLLVSLLGANLLLTGCYTDDGWSDDDDSLGDDDDSQGDDDDATPGATYHYVTTSLADGGSYSLRIDGTLEDSDFGDLDMVGGTTLSAGSHSFEFSDNASEAVANDTIPLPEGGLTGIVLTDRVPGVAVRHLRHSFGEMYAALPGRLLSVYNLSSSAVALRAADGSGSYSTEVTLGSVGSDNSDTFFYEETETCLCISQGGSCATVLHLDGLGGEGYALQLWIYDGEDNDVQPAPQAIAITDISGFDLEHEWTASSCPAM